MLSRSPLERDALHQLHGALPSNGDDDVSEGLGHETRFTICEVILDGNLVSLDTSRQMR
jgi:hypothetical protein